MDGLLTSVRGGVVGALLTVSSAIDSVLASRSEKRKREPDDGQPAPVPPAAAAGSAGAAEAAVEAAEAAVHTASDAPEQASDAAPEQASDERRRRSLVRVAARQAHVPGGLPDELLRVIVSNLDLPAGAAFSAVSSECCAVGLRSLDARSLAVAARLVFPIALRQFELRGEPSQGMRAMLQTLCYKHAATAEGAAAAGPPPLATAPWGSGEVLLQVDFADINGASLCLWTEMLTKPVVPAEAREAAIAAAVSQGEKPAAVTLAGAAAFARATALASGFEITLPLTPGAMWKVFSEAGLLEGLRLVVTAMDARGRTCELYRGRIDDHDDLGFHFEWSDIPRRPFFNNLSEGTSPEILVLAHLSSSRIAQGSADLIIKFGQSTPDEIIDMHFSQVMGALECVCEWY